MFCATCFDFLDSEKNPGTNPIVGLWVFCIFNKENKHELDSFFNPPMTTLSYKLFAFSGFGLFKPSPDHQSHSHTWYVKIIITRGTWKNPHHYHPHPLILPASETHGSTLHPRLSVYPVSCLLWWLCPWAGYLDTLAGAVCLQDLLLTSFLVPVLVSLLVCACPNPFPSFYKIRKVTLSTELK